MIQGGKELQLCDRSFVNGTATPLRVKHVCTKTAKVPQLQRRGNSG